VSVTKIVTPSDRRTDLSRTRVQICPSQGTDLSAARIQICTPNPSNREPYKENPIKKRTLQHEMRRRPSGVESSAHH
jgi:hypothetical protein